MPRRRRVARRGSCPSPAAAAARPAGRLAGRPARRHCMISTSPADARCRTSSTSSRTSRTAAAAAAAATAAAGRARAPTARSSCNDNGGGDVRASSRQRTNDDDDDLITCRRPVDDCVAYTSQSDSSSQDGSSRPTLSVNCRADVEVTATLARSR